MLETSIIGNNSVKHPSFVCAVSSVNTKILWCGCHSSMEIYVKSAMTSTPSPHSVTSQKPQCYPLHTSHNALKCMIHQYFDRKYQMTCSAFSPSMTSRSRLYPAFISSTTENGGILDEVFVLSVSGELEEQTSCCDSDGIPLHSAQYWLR